MNRLAVIAKLRPDTEARAEELVPQGPPFDPSGVGFERHSVFLTGDHALFVFEGGRMDRPIRSVVKDPSTVGAFRQWKSSSKACPECSEGVSLGERGRLDRRLGE